MTTKNHTRRSGRSLEDKRAEMEQLHDKLAAAVDELRSSDRWAAYLRFCAGFHRYSFSNLLLIWSKCPQASRVAGYRAWQATGRQVRKGERGIRIYGTGTVKIAADDQDAADEEAENGRRRVFFPVSVFDIAQTDVMDGHEDVPDIAHPLTGDDERGILARVVDHLTASGVVVKFAPLAGPNGYTQPGDENSGAVRVVIADHLSPAQQAKTALHEAAHIALGHVDDLDDYLAHRGRHEVEAESVAYVLAGMLGLDSADYSIGYVAGWAEQAEPDVVRDTASRVLAAVHTLAEELRIDDESAEEEAAA